MEISLQALGTIRGLFCACVSFPFLFGTALLAEGPAANHNGNGQSRTRGTPTHAPADGYLLILYYRVNDDDSYG